MADNDNGFYVEDETLEEVRAVMRRGERGETLGTGRLSARDQSIVDLAASRVESGGQVVQLLFGSDGEVTAIEQAVSNTKSEAVDITIPLESVAG